MDRDPKILLVDDEPLIRRSLQKTIERAGFEVVTAENCSSGLATFEAAREQATGFDLAVIDLSMPDFEDKRRNDAGLDLVSQIKTEAPQLGIIVLTAYDEVGKAKDALTRGASNFFVKGRDEGLVAAIEDLLA